jgi:glycerol-3-phosphate O-acyltransferase
VEQLANRLVERINWAAVANATAVGACALLGEPRRGVLRGELVRRMQDIVDLLRIQDVRLTPALVADEGEFRDSIAFLLRSDLIRAMPDPRGEILYYEESKRRALDLYRNAIIHFLATPSFLARALLAGGSAERLRADVADWLELLYQEFIGPREELLAAHVDGFLDYFERRGVVERCDEQLRAGEKGRAYLQFLAAQTRGVIEGYYAACTAALDVGEAPLPSKALLRRVREQFERGELLAEIRRPEGGNPVTFQNALDFLAARGILERRQTSGGRERRRDTAYVRGPAFGDLPALRERLAAALAAG